MATKQLGSATSLLIIASLMAACAKESPQATSRSVATAEGGLRISPTPSLDIAGDGPSDTIFLDRVGGAVRLPDGNIAVADRGATMIRIFGPDGKLIRTSGRRGSGPGEFRDLVSIHRCAADSLFAWDRMHSRMTVLDSAGTYVRTLRLPGDPVQISCSEAGNVAILSMAANSSMADSIVEGAIFVATTSGDSLGTIMPVPLGTNHPLGAMSSIALVGDTLYLGTGDRPAIRVYDLHGRALPEITLPLAAQRSTRAIYDATIDEIVAPLREAAARSESKKRLAAQPMPKFAPVYRQILPGPDGSIWVVVSPRGLTETQIVVMASDGNLIGKLRLAGDNTVLQVGARYLLTSYADPNAMPHIGLYSTNWPN